MLGSDFATHVWKMQHVERHAQALALLYNDDSISNVLPQEGNFELDNFVAKYWLTPYGIPNLVVVFLLKK